MCLLLTQPKGHTFTNSWLKDFYDYNADGIGVMYVEDGELHVHKLVPKSFNELRKFYRQHADGKECAVHLRMRTHGDIDLENCHPYKVFGKEEDGVDLWLMHNGVLSSGNAADATKSDTWHYINDIIRPALAGRPHEFTSSWFRKLIQEHIGSSNKFVMMDTHGNMEVFNKSSGVMWGDVWMSNTYAWSAQQAGVTGYGKYGSYGKYGTYGGYGSYSKWDDDYYEPVGKSPAIIPPPAKSAKESAAVFTEGEDYASRFMVALSSKKMYESYSGLSFEELTAYYNEEQGDAERLLTYVNQCEGTYDDDLDIINFFDERALAQQIGLEATVNSVKNLAY